MDIRGLLSDAVQELLGHLHNKLTDRATHARTLSRAEINAIQRRACARFAAAQEAEHRATAKRKEIEKRNKLLERDFAARWKLPPYDGRINFGRFFYLAVEELRDRRDAWRARRVHWYTEQELREHELERELYGGQGTPGYAPGEQPGHFMGPKDWKRQEERAARARSP
jgi:hypothetical protein